MVDRLNLKGFVTGIKKTPKKLLRRRYVKLQADVNMWQAMATSIRVPLDRLREAYDRHTDGQGHGSVCCIILCISPDRSLMTLIKATIDDFEKLERENICRRLATVEEAGEADDGRAVLGFPTKGDELDDGDDDDDGESLISAQSSVSKSLTQLVDRCSRLAKQTGTKAMSRSELVAELDRLRSELATLKSQYQSDHDRMTTLQAHFLVARERLTTPCARYEEYVEAIETALDGIGDGTSDACYREPSPRQPLIGNNPSVDVREPDRTRRPRTRPRLAERYQN